MIEHIREVTGKPVGFKAVVGAYGWLGTLAEEIHRRGIKSAPDFIAVDSAEEPEYSNECDQAAGCDSRDGQ